MRILPSSFQLTFVAKSYCSLFYLYFVIASMLKRPRTPTTNPAVDYQTADSEHVLKRTRPFGLSEEVKSISISSVLLCQ